MAGHDENTDKSDIRILESSSFIFYKAYFSWKRMSDKVLEPAGLTLIPSMFFYVYYQLQSLESKRQKPTQNDLARLPDSDVTMTSQA